MRLYNSQTRSVEPFEVHGSHVGVYVCGVTPYDTTHIGHAFTFLTFDILVRHLRARGHEVTYVQNVTDIDDDILRKGRELGMHWRELADRETRRYLQDMQDMHALPFDHYTAATDHMVEIQAITTALLQRGLAYEANGSVYFEVAKDPGFGKLSQLAPEERLPIANERGNDPGDPNKRDPLDFVLWQAAKPGEPTWESPWGPGRPGWHIECTAMATRYLGDTVDIHGGGYDLIFPHHECEIAQAENSTGVRPFVRFWCHVAMVDYAGEKMSKSLGNLVLVSELLQRYNADAVRLALFSHHYRANWEFEDDRMPQWQQTANAIAAARHRRGGSEVPELDSAAFDARFRDRLDDDLDTPGAIGVLRELADAIASAPVDADLGVAQTTVGKLADLLGLTLPVAAARAEAAAD